MSFVSFIEVY